MTTEEKILFNHLALAARVIESAFTLSSDPAEAIKQSTINIRFAKNSKLLKLFCDCSDNFEYEKLKKLIIKKNIFYEKFK